jgi:hypothetical protein
MSGDFSMNSIYLSSITGVSERNENTTQKTVMSIESKNNIYIFILLRHHHILYFIYDRCSTTQQIGKRHKTN